MSDMSVLGLFAHPDDEQMMSGTFAQSAARGMRTGLICATRGEAGQIHPSVDATRENIGEVREAELRAAAVVCGIKDLWFLDYCDSGWFGTPDNEDPSSFNKADHDEALGRIVAIVRQFKPTIMATFDRRGGYGHLDHLMIHKLATEAFMAAADPQLYPEAGDPWQAARLYYATFSIEDMGQWREMLLQADPDSDILQLDFSEFGSNKDEITHHVDVREWLAVKLRSLRSHRTQMADVERWSVLPEEMVAQIQGMEHFILAAGIPAPDGPEAHKDLFAGL